MASPTDDAPGPEKKLTPTEIAKDWGCSRAYASKCIGKGCPTDTLEKARAWRVANSKYGVGYRSKGRPTEAASPEAQSTETKESTPERKSGRSKDTSPTAIRDLSSIEASLHAAIEVEQEAHRLVIEAQKARTDAILSVRIAAYSKAQANRLEAEERVQKYLTAQRVLVNFAEAKAEARRGYDVLLPQLRALKRNSALVANADDPLRASTILSQEIEEVIAHAAKQYVA